MDRAARALQAARGTISSRKSTRCTCSAGACRRSRRPSASCTREAGCSSSNNMIDARATGGPNRDRVCTSVTGHTCRGPCTLCVRTRGTTATTRTQRRGVKASNTGHTRGVSGVGSRAKFAGHTCCGSIRTLVVTKRASLTCQKAKRTNSRGVGARLTGHTRGDGRGRSKSANFARQTRSNRRSTNSSRVGAQCARLTVNSPNPSGIKAHLTALTGGHASIIGVSASST